VATLFNVMLVVVGFGLVIFFHELGHFVAARWAGIRVHAFAMGFGPALVSWRKGLGVRAGSSEAEYTKIARRDGGTGELIAGISPTEYRLNVLPLGGYVRMLGQEDANPGAVSAAPDSFTSKPVWKRMVVVSAGVIMNIILAGVIFVGVFLHGIEEPPAIAGSVRDGSPAAAAGMRDDDIVRAVNGRPASSFLDLQIAAALAGPNDRVRVEVARADGQTATLEIEPREDPATRIRMIGVEPAIGAVVANPPDRIAGAREDLRMLLDRAGLTEVRPGMRLSAIDGAPLPLRTVWREQALATAAPLIDAARTSEGAPLMLTFVDDAGEVTADFTPRPEFQRGIVHSGGQDRIARHLAGLTPVMAVDSVQRGSGAEKAGLQPGDILAKIGSRAWPAIGEGIDEIQSRKGEPIDLVVLRGSALIPITAEVSPQGTIGFAVGEGWAAPIVAQTPKSEAGDATRPAAARMSFALPAGTRIDTIAGTPVADWNAIRAAIRAATADALVAKSGAEIPLGITILDAGSIDSGKAETTTIALTAEEVAAVHALAWHADPVIATFEYAMFSYKADGPVDALMMGIAKTHRYMLMTYVTLQRLFQQTVKVEHLKGPVGIADVGSQVAERGMIHLIFFLGVISINLAVVNFLPLPIVDGGLFLMLVYEGIVRKPVPMAVQNALTVVGLVLIGSMFLIVTFHDIKALF
jgi:regulator of sigma E protease